MALGRANLGACLVTAGRLDEARSLLLATLELREALLRERPASADERNAMAVVRQHLGNCELAAVRPAEAEKQYRAELELLGEAGSPAERYTLSQVLTNLSLMCQ